MKLTVKYNVEEMSIVYYQFKILKQIRERNIIDDNINVTENSYNYNADVKSYEEWYTKAVNTTTKQYNCPCFGRESWTDLCIHPPLMEVVAVLM